MSLKFSPVTRWPRQGEVCALCAGPLGKWGNNGLPVVNARVCDPCNDQTLLPARNVAAWAYNEGLAASG